MKIDELDESQGLTTEMVHGNKVRWPEKDGVML